MTQLGKSLEELVEISLKNKYPLEFSSALPYSEALIPTFLAYPYPKLVHNYFPAPQIPFVLNLASSNTEIRRTSINHCLQGIELTKKANATFFAAHAGFCVDPKPEELGKKFKQLDKKLEKDTNWELFLASINEILRFAEKEEIDFLIENNVVAQMNITNYGENPLFCGDGKEMLKLIKTINHPRLGILLDTAHLKVSGKTLGFDIIEHTKLIAPFVKAIHHSDNEGILDNNQKLPSDYWFLKFHNYFTNIPHVLEVKRLTHEEIVNQLNILSKFK